MISSMRPINYQSYLESLDSDSDHSDEANMADEDSTANDNGNSSSLRNHIVVVANIGTPGDTLLTSTPQQQQLPAESKLCGATSLFCKVQILEKPEKQPEVGEHMQKTSVFLHMIKL